MLNRVTATVEKYGLLEKGDSVIVALSGGADSTALLSVFVSLKEKYNLSIYAAHINHNIRGDEAKRDENFCKILCKKFNTELFIKSVDVPTLAKQQKISEDCNRSHGIRQCRNADIQYCKGCVFDRLVGNSSKTGEHNQTAD